MNWEFLKLFFILTTLLAPIGQMLFYTVDISNLLLNNIPRVSQEDGSDPFCSTESNEDIYNAFRYY